MQPIPGRTQPVRIVLADDHDLVRSGIKTLLSMLEGVEVVAEAKDGNELVSCVEALEPDVVMTDIGMPGMDGMAAIAQIHERFPQVRLVVLSAYDTVDFVKRAVAGGACGYLTKDAAPFELEQALRNVMTGGSYFSKLVTHRLLQPGEPTIEDELTPRQIEILRLIAEGRASKEIAFELGLSSKTVDVHRSRIMERLDLHDISSLTRYAIRKKLIQA
ncbi:MAG: putative response regulator, NarL [Ramlibacter sp.]|jgi:DNA-binding NarL/FixJ family response regulator|nr:putative response regulator, NarL [Ramlibacter sp.]